MMHEEPLFLKTDNVLNQEVQNYHLQATLYIYIYAKHRDLKTINDQEKLIQLNVLLECL